MAGGEEEEVEEDPWDVTPSSIANIRDMARNTRSKFSFYASK